MTSFESKYACDECSAVTAFTHYVDRNPSESVSVWVRKLSVKGQGEREGTDWKSSTATGVDRTKENRKGLN